MRKAQIKSEVDVQRERERERRTKCVSASSRAQGTIRMETGKGTGIVGALFSLQRRTKNPDGGLSYTYKNLFLSVCLYSRKKERGKPSSKNPCLSRVNTISIYSREQCSTLFGSKDGLSLYTDLWGPLFLPVFRVPYQCTTKGRMFVSKSKETCSPFYAVGIFLYLFLLLSLS